MGNPMGATRVDGSESTELSPSLKITACDPLDKLERSDGPPEPVAQVRVLPGALYILPDQRVILEVKAS